MPDRYTPGYAPKEDPGQGRVPDDVDPKRVLLTTMYRLGDRSENMSFENDHHRPFRYTLLCRETGLPGDTIKWHMKQLVNEGLAYEHRNGWGLQRRGVGAARRMLGDEAPGSAAEPRLSPELDVRDACHSVGAALWQLTEQAADAGRELEQERFDLAAISERSRIGAGDLQTILGVMAKREFVRFDGGYALTVTGLRWAHQAVESANLDELLERSFRGRAAAPATARARARRAGH